MVHVAEFTIPPEAFPFGQTLVDRPGVEIQVDQIVPTSESALPFFWVNGVDPEAFMEDAERETDVDETKLLEAVEDVALFRAEWHPNAAIIDGLRELDVTIVEAVGTAEHWRFELRAGDREQITTFQRIFDEQGIEVDLHRLYDLDELLEGKGLGLTPAQREALLAAYRGGYFEQPRETTQEQLGDQFGISRRAISERLRRGTANLVEATLLPEAASDGLSNPPSDG